MFWDKLKSLVFLCEMTSTLIIKKVLVNRGERGHVPTRTTRRWKITLLGKKLAGMVLCVEFYIKYPSPTLSYLILRWEWKKIWSEGLFWTDPSDVGSDCVGNGPIWRHLYYGNVLPYYFNAQHHPDICLHRYECGTVRGAGISPNRIEQRNATRLIICPRYFRTEALCKRENSPSWAT